MIFIFDKHADMANATRNLLSDMGLDSFVRYSPSTFPDKLEDWNNVDLVVMNPMAGYDMLPVEWRPEAHRGQCTGLVLMENLCPKKKEDRVNIPVVLNSSLYWCGAIHPEDFGGQTTEAYSKGVLGRAGFGRIYITEFAKPIAPLIDRVIAENRLTIRKGNIASS